MLDVPGGLSKENWNHIPTFFYLYETKTRRENDYTEDTESLSNDGCTDISF